MTYAIADGRLTSTAPLSEADFEAIAREVGYDIRRKVGLVAATMATEPTTVITYRNGKETENVAQPGDFIVINLLPQNLKPLTNQQGQPDQYVIKADRFAAMYDSFDGKHTEYGAVFKARSVVKAVYFPKGFDLVPPWGADRLVLKAIYFSTDLRFTAVKHRLVTRPMKLLTISRGVISRHPSKPFYVITSKPLITSKPRMVSRCSVL
jgi:hypothetical protein